MKTSAGANAESADPRLAAALRLEAASPTAENQSSRCRRVRAARDSRHGIYLHESRDAAEAAVRRSARSHGADLAGLGIRQARDRAGNARDLFQSLFCVGAQHARHTARRARPARSRPGAAFVRAAALDSNAAWALNNLCFVELRLGRLAEARSHCKAALVADPEMTSARNNLALIFVASGDVAAAGRAFLATGNVADAAYNRGIIHMAQRSYTRAAEAFEEAITARPGFTAAKTRAHEARMLVLTTSAHD